MNRRIWKRLLLPVLLAAVALLPAGAKAASYQCTARVPVSVELDGDSSEEFWVVLTPGEGAGKDLPMPEAVQLKIAGNSGAAFEGFHFTEPGDYVYTVRQTAGDTAYMTYDDTVYTLTIQVTNGKDGGLTYQIYAGEAGSTEGKVSSLTFRNTFTPPQETTSGQTEIGAPSTGDAKDLALPAAALAAALVVLAALGFGRKREDRAEP